MLQLIRDSNIKMALEDNVKKSMYAHTMAKSLIVALLNIEVCAG